MMNFRSLFTGQRNLALFISISILLILWLSTSFWVQAYVEREDAKKIQRFTEQENHLFDLSAHLSEQRSLIHRLLSGGTVPQDSITAYNDSLNTAELKIQDIRGAFLKDTQSISNKAQERASVGTHLLNTQLERIEFHQNTLKGLAARIQQQMQLPKHQRASGFKTVLFQKHTDFIEEIGDIRQSVHFVPRFTNQDVLYYSELSNSAWYLNENTRQVDSLLEGIILGGLETSEDTIINHANIINTSMIQSDAAVKGLLRQQQKRNVNSSLEVELDNVVDTYNQSYKWLSRQHHRTLINNASNISSLEKWRTETVQLKQHIEMLESRVKSDLISTVESAEKTALRNIIIDSILVLLCIFMATASIIYYRKMHREAHHDELTGLPNRRMFSQTFSKVTECSCIGKDSIWLLTIDLDRFKAINDSMGHAVGDKLLKQVADRLQGVAGDAHVARMGGDEFIILSVKSKEEDADELAEELHHCLSLPFHIDGGTLHIGGSVGVCGYPNDVNSPDELLTASDLAMYSAKNTGRSLVVRFEQSMATDYELRLRTEREFQFAVGGNQFELHFQPKFNRKLGKVDSVEALIRWNHPERGQVPPIQFIPIAEECGMLSQIGDWVLNEACRQAAKWAHEDGVPLRVAVNVSTEQFLETAFEEKVFGVLKKYQLDAKYLELEITESVVMADVDKVVTALNKLRSAGVKIALDDFGTEYSSLSYLQNLPLDTLKVDKSFVQKLEVGSLEVEAITQTITQLANTLGLETVAEGVETNDQLQQISDMGIDIVQGYLYSKPVPALDLITAIQQINGTDEQDADAA